MAKLEDVIQRGTNAARPAASAVAVGTLYYDTDNSSLARSNGTTWDSVEGAGGLSDQGTITYLDATEAAAPSTPSSGKVRIYAKSDGLLYSKDDAGTETLVSGGAGGGGGGAWTQVVNETGSSFTGFTALSGTWASDGTIIQQTNTAASVFRARYNTRLATSHMVVQVDVRFPSAGVTAAGGIILGWPGTDVANYPLVQIVNDATDVFQISQDALVNPLSETVTISDNTWYTVAARVSGRNVDGYLDGTLKGSVSLDGSGLSSANYLSHFVGLRAYDGTVDFRNFKVWVLTMPS